MKWLKENSFIAMLAVMAIAFLLVMYVKDEKIEKYEQIEVAQGDTLWSLAEHYRGKMSKEQWIEAVKNDNILFTDTIQAGQVLHVPVEKRSDYIAQLKQLEKAESKVASEK